MTDLPPTIGLRSVVFDCPDPLALATFYADLLGGRVVEGDATWCETHVDGVGLKLAFQGVDEYRRPEWPDGVPQQVHLDLTVTDMQATSRFAVGLGAEVLGPAVEEPGCVFVVHADPAGHPFCLCMEPPGS